MLRCFKLPPCSPYVGIRLWGLRSNFVKQNGRTFFCLFGGKNILNNCVTLINKLLAIILNFFALTYNLPYLKCRRLCGTDPDDSNSNRSHHKTGHQADRRC